MNNLEKIPPQNLEAEKSLLGSILIDKDAMIKIADAVDADDFYKNAHKDIFITMSELYSKNEPIDLLTVSSRLEEKGQLSSLGGRAYLASLSTSVPTSSHIKQYATIIRRKSTLRKLLSAASNITRLGFQEEEDDVEKLLDEAQQHLYGVTQKHLKQSFTDIRVVLNEAFERIDELHKERGKLRGIPTGFSKLDNLLAGLQKSDLVILAARPSVGKTSLALDIARQAALKSKIPVGIFSLEMSKEQLVDRMLCAEAGVDLWKMRTGNLSDRPDSDDFPRIGRAMGVLSEAPIFIDDTPGNNVMQIRTKTRRLQAEHGLGLIIIDYLQLMESHNSKGSDNRVQEVAEMSRNLKGLARELNVPVLALSQLSRAVEQTKPAIPKLSHLRESGCLAGETLIMNAKTGKIHTIKELAQRKKQTPIPVFSLDKNWRLVIKPMTKVFYSGQKKIYSLKLKSGRIIKASGNHPFRTLRDWTSLDNLNPGDRIAIARQMKPKITKSRLERDELLILAHLIGDGCIAPRQPIHYTSADHQNILAVKSAATRLFNISGKIVKQKNWEHLYLPSPYKLTNGKHSPITNWLKNLGLKLCRSYEKEIPNAVFESNVDDLAFFLRHLWSTDGNISWSKPSNHQKGISIYYSSTSELLARQVQHLLLRLEISSRFITVKSKKYRNCYQIHISSNEHQLKFLRKISSSGKRGKETPKMIKILSSKNENPNVDTIPKSAWKLFITPAKDRAVLSWRSICAKLQMSYSGSALMKSSIGRKRMSRLAKICSSQELANLAVSDLFWDEVDSIEPEIINDVYDATVPGTHNFLANDFVVHNSIEQDADVVMFIYRKAADRNYRPEDIQPDERNIGEIHIAKHRNGPTGLVKVFFDEARASYRNLDTYMEPSAPPPQPQQSPPKPKVPTF